MVKHSSGLSQAAQQDAARSAAASQPNKRPLDAASRPSLVPSKRLTRAGTRPPSVEQEKAQQAAKAPHQPNPVTAKRNAASPESGRRSIYSETRLKSVDTFVCGWLGTVEPGRRGRDGSDSPPNCPDHDSRAPRSPPQPIHPHDTPEGEAPHAEVPAGPYPFRGGGRDGSIEPPYSSSSDRSSGMSLVANPRYRTVHLVDNHVFLRDYGELLPGPVGDLVDRVGKKRQPLPGHLLNDLLANPTFRTLYLGATEPDIEAFYKGRVFPNTEVRDVLKRVDRQPMAAHTVPNTAGPECRISTPKPDMLYGYDCLQPFTSAQRSQVNRMSSEIIANNCELVCPFLAVEVKGQTLTHSANATNQCAGGSAACVNIAERFNSRLRDYGDKSARLINTAAFSIAMTGASADLYVTWKHNELDYYMTLVDSFRLQIPQQFLAFRDCVLNIIDWGERDRLRGIRDSLDLLHGIDPADSALPPSAGPGSMTSLDSESEGTSSRGRSRAQDDEEASLG